MFVVIFVAFALCLLLERARPGWRLPSVPGWWVRTLAFNAVQFGTVVLIGWIWEQRLGGTAVWHLSRHLGPGAAGATAYFFATFVFYWWHRARHASAWLWRVFHQVHHSPRRLEVSMSFYKHPIEMIANLVIGCLLGYTVFGLSPAAGGVYTLCTALGEFFYHTNITTPRWVGWFFQRPEMHRVHHEHDSHRDNYADIPLWDMLFGTYRNPPRFESTCGFDAALEERVADMLAWRDVHPARPRAAACSHSTHPPCRDLSPPRG